MSSGSQHSKETDMSQQPYQQQPPPPPPPQGYQQGPPQQYQQPFQQQPAPGYGAPQGYGQPQQPQPQGPPPTLDDYYSQPTGGSGPAVKFPFVGFEFEFRVARDVTAADLEQQTDYITKQLAFYPDGRRKFQLKIPLIVGVTADWPEGRATLYAKSGIREALDAAMATAGCPSRTFPKEGDTGWIRFSGTQAIQGRSDKKLFEARYTPGPRWSNLASSNGQAQRQPDGQPQLSAGVAAEAPQPWQGASPAPPPPAQPVAQTPPPPPPPPGAAPQQPAPPAPPQPQATVDQGTPQRPEGMTDEQFAQFQARTSDQAEMYKAATTGQMPPPPPPPGQAPPQR